MADIFTSKSYLSSEVAAMISIDSGIPDGGAAADNGFIIDGLVCFSFVFLIQDLCMIVM